MSMDTQLRLWTSHYSAGKLIASSGLVPVRTSLGSPRFKLHYRIEHAARLIMPTRDMLKLDEEPYEARYRQLLDERGLLMIAAELELIRKAAGPDEHGEPKNLVLLCFENLSKAGMWCHRRHFARWWQQHTGLVVPELELLPPPAPKPPRERQIFLF
jgi:hypothetical protein